MQAIRLPGSNRTTTQLGYGCSTLMGALGMKESLRLLEAAYEAGIRHYDVAPMYGFGQAEGCVGAFRQRHPDVTVTTKYGLPPAKNPGLLSAARRIAGPLVQRFPALKKRLSRAASTVATPTGKAAFTAVEARASLERSLRELRAEQIELWLLHEVEAGNLKGEGLRQFLDDAVKEGKIGAYGAASERAKVPELLAQRPEYCGVLQYEWSMAGDGFASPGAFHVFHRVLRDNYQTLEAALTLQPERRRAWSEAVGMDLGDNTSLSSLVLKAALVGNQGSLVLVSAKNLDHLRQNVRVAEDGALVEPAKRLLALMQRQCAASRSEAGAGLP